MRSHEFIFEYRRDLTSKQYGPRMITRFLSGAEARSMGINADSEHRDIMNAIFNLLEQGDPTPNNKYVPWLAREYALGNINMLEDIPSRLGPYLEIHNRRSRASDFPQELRDIMRTDARTFEREMSKYSPAEQLTDRGESRELINNNDIRVIIPLNEKAACYYGQGTRLCTAATIGTNYFERYNKDGPLYIIIPKNPKHTGEKYQIHLDSDQFMDEDDTELNLAEFYNDPRMQSFINYVKRLEGHEDYFKKFLVLADPTTISRAADQLMKIATRIAIDIAQSVDSIKEWNINDFIDDMKYGIFLPQIRNPVEFVNNMLQSLGTDTSDFSLMPVFFQDQLTTMFRNTEYQELAYDTGIRLKWGNREYDTDGNRWST